MTPIPAAIDRTWLHCRNSAPNADAVAPSPTNTVEKPATNRSAVMRMSRLRLRLALVDQGLDARAR